MDLRELIEKGRSRGYLYESEVRTTLPIDITEEDQVQDIFQMIKDMGIRISADKNE